MEKINHSKYVLVTGANGGIGKRLCKVYMDEGYKVVASDIHAQPDSDLEYSEYINVDLSRLVYDLEYSGDFFHEVSKVINSNGLDVLINNAAIQILGGVTSLTRDDWKTSINVNLLAPFLFVQALAEQIIKAGGCVINISSIHAKLTKKNFVAYATTKAALSGMTRAMAVDLGSKIRVNAIEPAATETEMLKAGFSEDFDKYEELKSYHPTECIASPDEIARLALFLCDKRNKFIQGSCVDISGGISGVLHDP